ncbi:osteoclast stimulatory transmembrane protein-like [Carcharodon carcharias]|uniref:osteoclast stimulatory transmembrane protein-like n=1 Tax=Carcharodon carcharias TaxID=13397 RepID=UPI001B7F7721|nr:osteoclast stimulatory transmembrane protein-like [Carcharodon carcharias]
MTLEWSLSHNLLTQSVYKMSACLIIASVLCTCLVGVQRQLSYAWTIYSKPTPCNIKELFILFLFYLTIAGAAGGLLYYWMSHTLQYKEELSGIIAGTLTSIVLLILFLVHPARCVFTLVIPTLGTKQGRKMILSGICLLIGANVVPNIVQHIKMLLELSQSLASILLLNLIAASVWYLTHYLTNLDFDNNYLTRKLEKLAKSSPTNCDKLLAAAGKLTKTTGLKLSQKEKKKCLVELGIPGVPEIANSLETVAKTFGRNLNFSNVKKNPRIVDIREKLPWTYNRYPLTVGMYIITYFMTALDVYAVRMRRKIAALFFQKQEEERICYLYQKVLKKYGKDVYNLAVIWSPLLQPRT